jgi:hypothetical protein
MCECWLCGRNEKENRYFDIFVNGSEGLVLCHQCEMQLVKHIQELKSLSTRAILIRAKCLKETSK